MYLQQHTDLPTRHSPLSRSRRRAVLSLTLAGLTGIAVAGAVVFSTCTFCYAVSAGEGPLYVQRTETCEAAVRQVENRVSRILQEDYRYEAPDLTPAIAPKEDLQTSEQLTDTLMETVEQVREQAVLTIDEVSVGVCDSRETIETALWQVKNRYITEDTVAIFLDNTVEITPAYVPADSKILSADELTQRLLEPDSTGLPPLLVRTVEEVKTLRSLPASTEGREDNTLLLGESITVQEGQDGTEEILDRVTLLCGEETQRETLSVTTLAPPTPTIIAVGTLEGVEGAQGRFQWPCIGKLTSPFGPRHIFGREEFHTGIDIALPQGSPISAAAAGTVVWVGPQGTYGNLVIVDHHNGFSTYYAHCSALLVDEGDEVSQGQEIAAVGSTGRSTGPHCHFEIRWREEPLDPQLCLP